MEERSNSKSQMRSLSTARSQQMEMLGRKTMIQPAVVVQEGVSGLRQEALQVPVLYIHGTDDRLVPHEMSRQLHGRTTSPKQIKIIPGGGHNNSASVGDDEYLKAVRDFIDFAHKSS